jgi:hypothetical protein
MITSRTTGIVGSALVALSLAGGAQSQENNEPVIVELYGCTFNDGNDMSDLMGVTRRWNAWADGKGVTNYTAELLTPYLYSTAFPYDVIWLGVYPNAEAMGAGQAVWLAEGDAMQAAFEEVLTCGVHAQYAGLAAHIPANPPDASDDSVGLTAFQDCSLHAERMIPDALAAHRQWGEFLAEHGSDNFMGTIIPIAGEDPDADYDYKAVTGFSSVEAYGKFLATVIPGGLERAGQLFGRVAECDTSRVYRTVQIRAAADGT